MAHAMSNLNLVYGSNALKDDEKLTGRENVCWNDTPVEHGNPNHGQYVTVSRAPLLSCPDPYIRYSIDDHQTRI